MGACKSGLMSVCLVMSLGAVASGQVLMEQGYAYLKISGEANGGTVTLGRIRSDTVTAQTAPGDSAAQVAAKIAAAAPGAETGPPLNETVPTVEAQGNLLKVTGASLGTLYFRTTDTGLDTIGAVSDLKAVPSKADNAVTLSWSLPSPAPATILIQRLPGYARVLPGTATSNIDLEFGDEARYPPKNWDVTYIIVCRGTKEYVGEYEPLAALVSDYVEVETQAPDHMPDDVFRVLTGEPNFFPLPKAVTNTEYSATIWKNGGADPVSWSIAAGSLPAGLTLSTDGAITGTPTGIGASDFTVEVTDATDATATMALSIVVTEYPILTGAVNE